MHPAVYISDDLFDSERRETVAQIHAFEKIGFIENSTLYRTHQRGGAGDGRGYGFWISLKPLFFPSSSSEMCASGSCASGGAGDGVRALCKTPTLDVLSLQSDHKNILFSIIYIISIHLCLLVVSHSLLSTSLQPILYPRRTLIGLFLFVFCAKHTNKNHSFFLICHTYLPAHHRVRDSVYCRQRRRYVKKYKNIY